MKRLSRKLFTQTEIRKRKDGRKSTSRTTVSRQRSKKGNWCSSATTSDPIFGPELYKVVDIKGDGTTLLRLSDSTIFRRHLDDIKDASAISPAEPGEMCWIDGNVSKSPQREPQPLNPLVAADPPPEAAVRPNAANRPQRERQPPAYYRDDQWEMRR